MPVLKNIKYPVLIYNRGSRFFEKFKHSPRKPSVLCCFFPGAQRFFEGFEMPGTGGSLILAFIKYMELVVLMFKIPRTGSYLKFKELATLISTIHWKPFMNLVMDESQIHEFHMGGLPS
jgi:hypothetical protein